MIVKRYVNSLQTLKSKYVWRYDYLEVVHALPDMIIFGDSIGVLPNDLVSR